MRNPFILTIGLSLVVLLLNSGWISYRTLVAALASDNDNRHSRNKNELASSKTSSTSSSSSSPSSHQLTSTKTRRKSRHRRDIWQLYGVIRCKTPCDPFILKNYGCYCGLGGTGSPMDDVDRCCMLHDYCYHNTPCHQALTYFLPYNWKCIAGRPHCSIPPRWTPIYACSLHLCECDRLFSECLYDYGCPKDKTICGTDQYRRVWQKFLIRLGIG